MPTLTGAKQTMQSWARLVETIDEVPEPFRAAYQRLARNFLTYTVFAPAQHSTRHSQSPDRLLCDSGDALVVFEQRGPTVEPIVFPYANIASFETGNVLLYSWFTVQGLTAAPTAQHTNLTVEFNEACRRHFEPFFRRMRPAINPAADLQAERLRFAALSEVNFKFASFARQSLVPGQTLQQLIYQPAIRRPAVQLLSSLTRTLCLPHLTLLTCDDLILIGEADHVPEKERGKYGGVKRCLPLRHLLSADLQPRPDGLLRLVLQLSYGFHLERIFDPSLRSQLDALVAHLKN
jgi:hypothetical protein